MLKRFGPTSKAKYVAFTTLAGVVLYVPANLYPMARIPIGLTPTSYTILGGIIELFVEDGRMLFAINVDAADRAGVRLSSRLLGLAKVTRTPHVQ